MNTAGFACTFSCTFYMFVFFYLIFFLKTLKTKESHVFKVFAMKIKFERLKDHEK